MSSFHGSSKMQIGKSKKFSCQWRGTVDDASFFSSMHFGTRIYDYATMQTFCMTWLIFCRKYFPAVQMTLLQAWKLITRMVGVTVLRPRLFCDVLCQNALSALHVPGKFTIIWFPFLVFFTSPYSLNPIKLCQLRSSVPTQTTNTMTL